MFDITTFLQTPEVGLTMFIIGVFGFIFGAASTIISISSTIKQRKRDVPYKALLDQAALDWVGKYTEKQIEELKIQFEDLYKKVNIGIPKLAHRLLLENQVETLSNSIATQYNQYKEIKDKLSDNRFQSDLPISIEKDLEAEILPYNLRRRNKSTYYIIIAIILLGSLIIIPYISSRLYNEFLSYYLVSYSPSQLTLDFATYVVFATLFVSLFLYLFPDKHALFSNKQIVSGLIYGSCLIILWLLIVAEVVFEYIQLPRYAEIVGSFISYIPLSFAFKMIIRSLKHMRKK